MILPDDHFLKRVPIVLESDFRFRLQSIGFAIESIDYAYTQLKYLALNLVSAEQEFPSLVPMFNHAWSMVDRVHALRALLQTLHLQEGGVIATYVAKHEAGTLLRNHMDHLHQKIKNMSKKKGSQNPIFGALAFSHVRPDQIRVTADGTAEMAASTRHVLMPSTDSRGTMAMMVKGSSGSEIELPVGQFTIEADDNVFDLSQAWLDLRSVADRFNTYTRMSVEDGIRHFAELHMLDVNRLLSEYGGDMIASADIKHGKYIDENPPAER